MTDEESKPTAGSDQVGGSSAGAGRRRRERDGRYKARRPGSRRVVAAFDAAALGAVRPIALNRLTVGTVIYAHLPFADGAGSDARPAVIVAVDGRTLTVFRIRTHRPWRHAGAPDAVIEEWMEAGLSRPSNLDRRPVTIDAAAVNSVVGELAEADRLRNGIGSPAASDGGAEIA